MCAQYVARAPWFRLYPVCARPDGLERYAVPVEPNARGGGHSFYYARNNPVASFALIRG